tara:strand:- start:398 stop:1450 length:1053 start_codon:yes stop_codon:yes gene_type:complete
MAEKDKRSRALLRNLRKQARKGTLSSRERKTLLDQESKFRKARRGTAKGVGLGLAAGAAGLLASPAAQRALGAAADRFKSSKADRKASKAEEEKAKAFNELQESATPTADADQAVAKRVMQGGEDFNAIPEGPETVDFSDPKAMGATRASSMDIAADKKAREKGFKDAEDYKEQSIDFLKRQEFLDKRDALGEPSDIDFSMPDGPTGEDLDRLRTDRVDRVIDEYGWNLPMEEADRSRLGARRALRTFPEDGIEVNRGQATDLTGGFGSDIDYSDLQGLRDRDLRRRQLASDKRDREAGVAGGRQIAFDREFPAGMPLASQDGPRVQAQGGKVSQADKLRKMIAKKYGIR